MVRGGGEGEREGKSKQHDKADRSAWYDRLALILMTHYNASPEEKEEKCRDATQTCIDALLDDDTHLSKSSPIFVKNR